MFLRAGQLAQLEGTRGRRLTASALTIQAAFRCIARASAQLLTFISCSCNAPFMCRVFFFIAVSTSQCRGLMARRELRDARRAATLIAATWRGYVGRRMARQQRRDTAATRIAAAWRCFRARQAFKAYQVQCPCALVTHELRDMWSLLRLSGSRRSLSLNLEVVCRLIGGQPSSRLMCAATSPAAASGKPQSWARGRQLVLLCKHSAVLQLWSSKNMSADAQPAGGCAPISPFSPSSRWKLVAANLPLGLST